MDNSLLKQILNEYELKRSKAISEADIRKKNLLSANPRLAEIEKEIAELSLKNTKAILFADEKEKNKIISTLKKEINSLLKEKNTFLKTICKDSRIS